MSGAAGVLSPGFRSPPSLRTAVPAATEPLIRDLYRGHSVQLPSGEAVARALGIEPCTATELKTADAKWPGETPLWLYVLAEAEVQHRGERLGEVGGRIVAEVIFELLRKDPKSFVHDPTWRPGLTRPVGEFGMADLLTHAGVV
jgi:hypothetical protein